MPSIQSLVITDRQSTPVNHTLLPVSEKDGLVTLALADATGAVITEKRFTAKLNRTPGRVRYTQREYYPVIVTETINGVSSPVVLRTALVETTFLFTDTHTEAERNDVVGMHVSSLAVTKPLTHGMIVKGEAAW